MHSVQNNMQMTAAAPRLRQPKLNTKKKMIIYITLAAAYLLAVLIAGLLMDPALYAGASVRYGFHGARHVLEKYQGTFQ